MTDKPILFSGPMVRAILRNEKTQTRRVIHEAEPLDGFYMYPHYMNGKRSGSISKPPFWEDLSAENGGKPLFSGSTPYCPGDLLWVRETWTTDGCADGHVAYRADGEAPEHLNVRWRPSIRMPKWAVRIWLRVTGVKVERLQDISNEDAQAEGCSGRYAPCHPDFGVTDGQMPWEEYRELWDSLYAKRGHGWDANPWVVAITFERIER